MSKTNRERRQVRSARERAEKHTNGFESTSIKIPEGVKLFKLKPGTMLVDIIPYEAGEGNPFADKGELHYERTYFAHRNVGPGGDSYVCLKRTTNQPCPVCEWRNKLAKDPDADEDLIKDMAPRERQLFNVIDCRDREAGVQLWDISYHLFGKLLDARIQSDEDGEGWDMFHSPTDGFTLRLTVEEEKYGTNTFCKVTAIDFKSRKEQYEDSIIDDAHCLDELLRVEDYDKLKALLLQTDDESAAPKSNKPSKKSSDDDDDEDEPKKPSKKSSDNDDDDDEEDDTPPAKKKSSKEEDDDEDEAPKSKKKPAASDDDDEDEDTPPAKSSKKPAASDDDDDEDEAPAKKPAKKKALDDDDDEEEAPAKKKSAPADDDDDEDEPKKPAKKSTASDDDEDEEPAPKKKSSKEEDDDEDEVPAKKPAKKSSDDDDDDDWGDDDEDEAPKSKKK